MRDGVPDAESHLCLQINNRPTDINFRYYSPTKSSSSPSIAGEERLPTIPHSNRSDTIQNTPIVESKKALDPFEASQKFYDSKMDASSISLLNYYQKFHGKLIKPYMKSSGLPSQKQVIKISLSDQTRNSMSHAKSSKSKAGLAHKKTYVRKAHINLCSNKGKKDEGGAVSHLKIKLFEQMKDSRDIFKTPRSSSKKGIRVYSSVSSNKHGDSNSLEESHKKIQNSVVVAKPIKKENANPRRVYHSPKRSELKSNVRNTKRRVYSKSKLNTTLQPRVNLQERKK